MDKTIAVIGSGYVGVTTAAIAANAGYKVHLIDVNPKRIEVLKNGKSFFFEEGINPLIEKAVNSGALLPSIEYDGVKESGIVFSCVGTPDNPDGSSNLRYVFAAAETAASLLQHDAVYVQKSTVPVGTGAKVITKLPEYVHYVSNPEFLRESTAVGDTLYFDRIVAGGSNTGAVERLMEIYRTIEQRRYEIADLAGLDSRWKTDATTGQYIATNLESAELIKVTANAFLALKISFANNIAKLADEAGADVVKVMDAVGADRRIGRAFLNAGRGYGGGCFPKDVSGLISSAAEHGIDMPIMTAATDINASMPGYIAEKAQEKLGSLQGKRLAVLGLAFKSGTSDARKSPSVALANILSKNGAEVYVYDPEAIEEAKEDLRSAIVTCESIADCVKEADAVFVGTDWPEIITADYAMIKSAMRGRHIFDGMNALDAAAITSVDLEYTGVGR